MENSRIYHQIYDPVPYLLIENTFNQQEMELIWEELEFLNQPGKLLPPDKTESAESPDGKILKKNKAVFLNELFAYNHSFSNILRINRSILSNETKELFSELNFGYNSIWQTNKHTTLINYYGDGDYYDPHIDEGFQTFITFFYREPKKFSGGDFWLSSYNHRIEIQNNMTIAIPSFLFHHVDTVNMDKKNHGLGRYSMTVFTSLQNVIH